MTRVLENPSDSPMSVFFSRLRYSPWRLFALRVSSIARDHDRVPFHLHRHLGIIGLGDLALGALQEHRSRLDGHLHSLGDLDRQTTDSRHCLLLAYQMLQSSSPPAFFSRAFLPVVTPREVVTMIVPKPLRTRGRVL